MYTLISENAVTFSFIFFKMEFLNLSETNMNTKSTCLIAFKLEIVEPLVHH